MLGRLGLSSASSFSRSQVSGRRLRLAPTLPGDGTVPLLPQGDPVAGTYLFGVLEEASRSSDDPTGQSVTRGETGQVTCSQLVPSYTDHVIILSFKEIKYQTVVVKYFDNTIPNR